MGFVGKAFKAIGKVIGKVVGFATKIVGGVFGFIVGGKKEKKAASVNNLQKSLEPEAYRKIILGRVATPLDVRYWEVYGSGNKSFDEVIALATHKITAVYDLWLDDKLAINSSGQVQAPYIGLLSRQINMGTPGQTALSVGGGGLWTSTSKFTGCAHMVLKWLVDEEKLPNGVPSRYTLVAEGAPVYDPRRDSTMGGSGPHRWDNQDTWEYSPLDANGVPIGRNNALQTLWYLLGWRIANPVTGEMVLVAGRGVIIDDINMSTFIAGANACEIAGYYTDVTLSTGEDHTGNEDKITCDGLIGRLLDPGGLWSYYANVNDTANIALELTDADVIEGANVSWNEYRGMNDQYNQVVGKYVNPSNITLFQPFPYPMVRDATYEANLGRKRRRTQDFEQVLDYVLAQRLARLVLNEGQYQGEFSSEFMPRCIKAQAWSVVRYTSERFNWTKLFRVWRHDIMAGGKVGMLLKEIHPSIWNAGTVENALVPVRGVNFDPAIAVPVNNLIAAQYTMTGAGSNPLIWDGVRVSWLPPVNQVDRTEVRYKLTTAADYTSAGFVMRATTPQTLVIYPLLKGSAYTIEARTISTLGIASGWAVINNFVAGVAGNIVLAGDAVLGLLDPLTGRIVDPTIYNTSLLLGPSSTTNLAATYTVGASNVTVNLPAHIRTIAGINGPIQLNYGAGSGVVPFSTRWYAYITDLHLTGFASPVFIFTTNANDLLVASRYTVASDVSPAAGATSGPVGGTGGDGGGYTGGGGGIREFNTVEQ